MEPVVSIIGVTYNQAKLMERGLRIWLKQTFNLNYELIVVDDGCTDNTEQVIKELQKKHKQLRYIKLLRDKEGKQLSCAVPFNVGLKAARGKIVVFTWWDRIPTTTCLYDLYYPHLSGDGNTVVSLLAKHIATYSSMNVLSDEILDSILSTVNWEKNPELLWDLLIDDLNEHTMPSLANESACFSLAKSKMIELGGYDERYTYVRSHCNIDLWDRFKRAGMNIIWKPNAVFHQPHPSTRSAEDERMRHREASLYMGQNVIRNPDGFGKVPFKEIKCKKSVLS